MKKSLNENLRQIALLKFENHSIKYKKYTKNALQHRINVYLKLSVAVWWSTVAYKTHAEYPYYEPVLLQSKGRTWYLHFSEELEVVRGGWLFMLQQEKDMNLYSFNKVSLYTGYDNKGQHFEK